MEDNKRIKELLEEVVALLSIQVKRDIPQGRVIKELNEAGIQPKRIAEIVGTTPNTVRVTVHHAKKASKGGQNE